MGPEESSPEGGFVLCIDNRGYQAALEVWKVYRTLPDERAGSHGMVRVIDESGEDYLYSDQHFVPIDVPEAALRALPKAS